jgi:hypothetical protein
MPPKSIAKRLRLQDSTATIPSSCAEDAEHLPFTHDDSCIQVRFDPLVESTRRRKSSLAQNIEDETGSAFLHKILGLDGVQGEEEEEKGEGGLKAKGKKKNGLLRSMTRSQLHDMVLGLREMGRKYGMFPPTYCLRMEGPEGEGRRKKCKLIVSSKCAFAHESSRGLHPHKAMGQELDSADAYSGQVAARKWLQCVCVR